MTTSSLVSGTRRVCRPFVPYDRHFTGNGTGLTLSSPDIAAEQSDFLFHEIVTQGFHLIQVTAKRKLVDAFAVKNDAPFISLVFCSSGKTTHVNMEKMSIFSQLYNGQTGLLYLSNQPFEIHWESEEGGELLIINFTLSYFLQFLPQQHPLFETFKSSVTENTPALLTGEGIPQTGKLRTLMGDLFQYNLKDHYKYMYFNAKLLEVLMVYLQEYENRAAAQSAGSLEHTNLLKMYEVRDIIVSNLSKPCSLVDLAQQVGTNECYLKKYFKEAFGTTVFGYLHRKRMERSREILMNQKIKIAEVAKISGYKHASHFTTAFKKYFGYLPNQIKTFFVACIAELQELLYILEGTPAVI